MYYTGKFFRKSIASDENLSKIHIFPILAKKEPFYTGLSYRSRRDFSHLIIFS